MNAAAFASFRPVAGAEPDDRRNPSSNVTFLPIISTQKSHLADADKDSGYGLRLSNTGRLVSVPWGRRCRWMSLHCQLYVCLCWNWCLRYLVMALTCWLWGPLERFLSLHRWGIAGWAVAALSLHLVWQDPFRLFIWGGAATFLLWYWAMWNWPARRMAA